MNPDHVEVVTPAEHTRRSHAVYRKQLDPNAVPSAVYVLLAQMALAPRHVAVPDAPVEQRCSVTYCAKRRVARGWCTGHYQRAKKEGRCPPRATLAQRFWAKVDKNGPVSSLCPDRGPCWLWRGALSTKTRYGSFGPGPNGQPVVGAHRISYYLTHGSFPPRPLDLDHVCRVRHCVNPSHLEPVTRLENVRRGRAYERAKTQQPIAP